MKVEPPQSSITSLVSELRADVRAGKLLPALSAGVILGLIQIVYEILFGALVFSGPLAPFLSQGIGIMLFGSFAVCLGDRPDRELLGNDLDSSDGCRDRVGDDQRRDPAGRERAVRDHGGDRDRRLAHYGCVPGGDRVFPVGRSAPVRSLSGRMRGSRRRWRAPHSGGVVDDEGDAGLASASFAPGNRRAVELGSRRGLWPWPVPVHQALEQPLDTARRVSCSAPCFST